MKPTVENFEILGLFGGKDVKLSFTNKVQSYIGENGLGKTTVLNTLYYLLSLKFEELVNINFSEIKIRINEKNYSFTKTDLQGYVNRNRERNRKSGIYNHIDKLLDDNTILSLKKKLNFITYLFYHRRYSLKFRENFSAKAELETAPKQ